MNFRSTAFPLVLRPLASPSLRARIWMRELALCAGITGLLVLDIGALGNGYGFAALDQMAGHLWGPRP